MLLEIKNLSKVLKIIRKLFLKVDYFESSECIENFIIDLNLDLSLENILYFLFFILNIIKYLILFNIFL